MVGIVQKVLSTPTQLIPQTSPPWWICLLLLRHGIYGSAQFNTGNLFGRSWTRALGLGFLWNNKKMIMMILIYVYYYPCLSISLIRHQQLWPKRHPLMMVDAPNIWIKPKHTNDQQYVSVFVSNGCNTVFIYGCGQQGNRQWRKMQTNHWTFRWSQERVYNLGCIARLTTSRASLEAIRCHHRASACAALPRWPPWSTNLLQNTKHYQKTVFS